jgi:hypothetical protein
MMAAAAPDITCRYRNLQDGKLDNIRLMLGKSWNEK